MLDANAKSGWLWKNRHVYIFDGATVSMPDTYENQQAYPQPPQQKPGLGFPFMSHRGHLFAGLRRGARRGPLPLRRQGTKRVGSVAQLWSIFQPGSIMLADRLMCAWTELVMLKQRSVESVCRFTSHRRADFRRGKRLGKDDHIVTWHKPTKPRSIDRQTYNTLPESLTIRECRVPIAQPAFRVKVVVIATTLLDHVAYPPSELAKLYRRWNAELDLRSLKQTLQMDVLRCKTPELVRTSRAPPDLGSVSAGDRAARRTRRGPLESIPHLARRHRHPPRRRPPRSLTRVKKRHHRKFAYLRKPRTQIKRDMAQGLIVI